MTPTPGRPTATPACPRRAADERVVLWLQNSHATPIPAGAVTLDRMGAEQPVPLPDAVGPFATVAIDVAALLPGVRWPAQIELRAGRHVVRPRYEVTRADRTRIAHVNVERADLQPDPGIAALPAELGRGYLLPFPVLPRDRFRTIVQPTPMAETQIDLPIRLDLFDTERPQGGRAVPGVSAAQPRPGARSGRAGRCGDRACRAGLRLPRRRRAPMAGCTPCSATRIARPATLRSPASARMCSTR